MSSIAASPPAAAHRIVQTQDCALSRILTQEPMRGLEPMYHFLAHTWRARDLHKPPAA